MPNSLYQEDNCRDISCICSLHARSLSSCLVSLNHVEWWFQMSDSCSYTELLIEPGVHKIYTDDGSTK